MGKCLFCVEPSVLKVAGALRSFEVCEKHGDILTEKIKEALAMEAASAFIEKRGLHDEALNYVNELIHGIKVLESLGLAHDNDQGGGTESEAETRADEQEGSNLSPGSHPGDPVCVPGATTRAKYITWKPAGRLKKHDDWMACNKKGETLGWLQYERVGRFMHWCWHQAAGFYMSPGCLEEVRVKQKELARNYKVKKK